MVSLSQHMKHDKRQNENANNKQTQITNTSILNIIFQSLFTSFGIVSYKKLFTSFGVLSYKRLCCCKGNSARRNSAAVTFASSPL